jgi:general secretion pathway protein L
MSSTTLLLLPPLAQSPALRLVVDRTGAIVSRQSLAADALPATASEPCVLAVPAADVALHRLRLRANSPAQAVAAAARLVEDRLAVPHATLHVAVSEANDQDERWVAVVDPARMKAWLERAARHGLRPTAVVPDCLLLAAPEPGGWRVLETDAAWQVRGETMAFSAEPDLARAVLDGQGATDATVHAASEADLACGAVVGPPAIDLLQQAFSLRAAAPTGWAAWRSVGVLAAVVLALLPLGFAAQALRHGWAVQSIQDRATSQLQATAAVPGAEGAPFQRANAALAAARSRDAFAITTGALFESLAQVPGAGVSVLDFGEDSVLAVTLDHDQANDLERLTAGLAERGVSAALDTTQASDGRLRSTLLLGVAP